MAQIFSFPSIRPEPSRAADVASVPYDVVDTEEARRLASGNKDSFLHVIRAEIDLPEGGDAYASTVYETARRNLEASIEDGVMIRDDDPSVYVYRLQIEDHVQTGIAACCAVEEYDNGTIRRHEHTRPEKVDDRVRHMLGVSAHTGPVLLTYRESESIDDLVENEVDREPLYDLRAEDGVHHTIWRIPDPAKLIDAFREVRYLYIADGHHRAAGASRVHVEIDRTTKPGANDVDQDEHRRFLAVLFPRNRLRILAYNRHITLDPNAVDRMLEACGSRFVSAGSDGDTGYRQPTRKGEICIYAKGRAFTFDMSSGRPIVDSREGNPVANLDLTIFENEVLEPVLGPVDQKADARFDFIGGEDSGRKLKEKVDRAGGMAVSFFPVSVSELISIADAGQIMPPKSTWFSPKLRSGLLVHPFDSRTAGDDER